VFPLNIILRGQVLYILSKHAGKIQGYMAELFENETAYISAYLNEYWKKQVQGTNIIMRTK